MPLTVTIEGKQFVDNDNNIISEPSDVLVLEHSLISISKWEAIWKKPYLESFKESSNEELYSYIQCMVIKGNADMSVLRRIKRSQYEKILDYINDSMTATTVKKKENDMSVSNFTTSELIYAWMVQLQIPWEAQKWHLNRLMMLISVLDRMNQPAKKRSEKQLISDYAKINAMNRARFKSKG